MSNLLINNSAAYPASGVGYYKPSGLSAPSSGTPFVVFTNGVSSTYMSYVVSSSTEQNFASDYNISFIDFKKLTNEVYISQFYELLLYKEILTNEVYEINSTECILNSYETLSKNIIPIGYQSKNLYVWGMDNEVVSTPKIARYIISKQKSYHDNFDFIDYSKWKQYTYDCINCSNNTLTITNNGNNTLTNEYYITSQYAFDNDFDIQIKLEQTDTDKAGIILSTIGKTIDPLFFTSTGTASVLLGTFYNMPVIGEVIIGMYVSGGNLYYGALNMTPSSYSISTPKYLRISYIFNTKIVRFYISDTIGSWIELPNILSNPLINGNGIKSPLVVSLSQTSVVTNQQCQFKEYHINSGNIVNI